MPFQAAVLAMQDDITKCIPGDIDVAGVKNCAVALVLNGFRQVEHLDGLLAEDLKCFRLAPACEAILRQLVENVANKAKRRKLLRAASFDPVVTTAASSSLVGQPAVAAGKLAKVFKATDVEQVHKDIADTLSAWEAEGVGTTLSPQQAIYALGSAEQRGGPMQELLRSRAAALRLESRRSSLPQVASALRCWHAFAVTVLHLPDGKTLPPRSGTEVEAFIGIFKSAGTAQNYVSAIKWVCNHLSLATDWYTTSLQLTLQGARKRAQRLRGGPQHARKLLTDDIVQKLIRLATATKKIELAALYAVAWEFHFRVQSEAIPLEVGNADEATHLPASRHSAVWIDVGGSLCIRLRQRKIVRWALCSVGLAPARRTPGTV